MQERRGPLDLARFGCDNCAAAGTRSERGRLAMVAFAAVQRTHACPVHVLRYQARARVQVQGHMEPLQAA